MKKLFTALLIIASFSLANAQNCNAPFRLGNDTTVNCNSGFIVSAPLGMVSYLWNTGASSSSITVNQSGTYSYQGTRVLNSVVSNGDFSQGNVGFSSAYSVFLPNGAFLPESNYSIVASPNIAHSLFSPCFDHTSGTAAGRMMVVNAANIANVNIWGQNITVLPNTNYRFSAWAMTTFPANPAQLRFSINGTQLGNTLTLPLMTCIWQQFFIVWNSGSNTTANISIINQNTGLDGNDFALDDISFSLVCQYSDAININCNDIAVDFAADTVCLRRPVQMRNLTTGSRIASYRWQLPNWRSPSSFFDTLRSTAKNPVFSINLPNQNLPFINVPVSLFVTDSLGNVLKRTKNIVFRTPPQIGLLGLNGIFPNQNIWFLKDTTMCQVAPHRIGTSISNYNAGPGNQSTLNLYCNDSLVYTQQSASLISLDFAIRKPGLYYATISNSINGCADTSQKVRLLFNPLPKIQILGDTSICRATRTRLFTPWQAGTSYSWFKDGVLLNSTTSASLDTALQVGAPGLYGLVGVGRGGCISELVRRVIEVNSTTDKSCMFVVPNIITPNNDGLNDIFKITNLDSYSPLSLKVYNRWGKLVYEQSDYKNTWDGADLGSGTYFVHIQTAMMPIHKGWITILK